MPKAPLTLPDLAGQNVLIVGVGREGQAVASRLVGLDPAPTVFALDGREGQATEDFRQAFPDIPVYVTQDLADLPEAFRAASVAVVSPGIPITSELHQALTGLSLRLTSSSALFVAEHREHMVGITGSKGIPEIDSAYCPWDRGFDSLDVPSGHHHLNRKNTGRLAGGYQPDY